MVAGWWWSRPSLRAGRLSGSDWSRARRDTPVQRQGILDTTDGHCSGRRGAIAGRSGGWRAPRPGSGRDPWWRSGGSGDPDQPSHATAAARALDPAAPARRGIDQQTPRTWLDRARTTDAGTQRGAMPLHHWSKDAFSLVIPRGQMRSTRIRTPSSARGWSCTRRTCTAVVLLMGFLFTVRRGARIHRAGASGRGR